MSADGDRAGPAIAAAANWLVDETGTARDRRHLRLSGGRGRAGRTSRSVPADIGVTFVRIDTVSGRRSSGAHASGWRAGLRLAVVTGARCDPRASGTQAPAGTRWRRHSARLRAQTTGRRLSAALEAAVAEGVPGTATDRQIVVIFPGAIERAAIAAAARPPAEAWMFDVIRTLSRRSSARVVPLRRRSLSRSPRALGSRRRRRIASRLSCPPRIPDTSSRLPCCDRHGGRPLDRPRSPSSNHGMSTTPSWQPGIAPRRRHRRRERSVTNRTRAGSGPSSFSCSRSKPGCAVRRGLLSSRWNMPAWPDAGRRGRVSHACRPAARAADRAVRDGVRPRRRSARRRRGVAGRLAMAAGRLDDGSRRRQRRGGRVRTRRAGAGRDGTAGRGARARVPQCAS